MDFMREITSASAVYYISVYFNFYSNYDDDYGYSNNIEFGKNDFIKLIETINQDIFSNETICPFMSASVPISMNFNISYMSEANNTLYSHEFHFNINETFKNTIEFLKERNIY